MSNWAPYLWQEPTWEYLSTLEKEQRLPHALLAQGESGIGKAHLIHGFTSKLLCTENDLFACGHCKSCTLIEAGTHPDFRKVGLLEKSKLIKVDQVRELVEFFSKTAQMGGYKIAIIEVADQMNVNAANALLKCLEEPSGKSLIILLTHAPNRLLPTIKSRCQNIAMHKPEFDVAEKWLANFVFDPLQRTLLLDLANGNPLLAADYHDRDILSFYHEHITQIVELPTGKHSLTKIAEKVAKGDVALWLALNQNLISKMIQVSMECASSDQYLKALSALLSSTGFAKKGFKMLEDIQQASYEINGPSNPNVQLMVESLLIRWQALLRS